MLRLGAQSPAQAIEVGTNYDEQMTPPLIVSEFFAPFNRGARDILESIGKILVVHEDGKCESSSRTSWPVEYMSWGLDHRDTDRGRLGW